MSKIAYKSQKGVKISYKKLIAQELYLQQGELPKYGKKIGLET